MSESVQMAALAKNKWALHAAICTGIFAVLTIAAVFSSKVHLGFFGYIALFLSGSIFTSIGVVVGDVLRNMAMPDFYTTRGFADSIKKKIFWAIGPQAIGWFIGFIATNGFMQNYLGYNMRNDGVQRQVTTEEVAKLMSAPLTDPVELSKSVVPELVDAPEAASQPESLPQFLREQRIEDRGVQTIAGFIEVGYPASSDTGPKVLKIDGVPVEGTEADHIKLVALYKYEGHDVVVFTHACGGSSCGYTAVALLRLNMAGDKTFYRHDELLIAKDDETPGLQVDQEGGIIVTFQGFSGHQTWRYFNGEFKRFL